MTVCECELISLGCALTMFWQLINKKIFNLSACMTSVAGQLLELAGAERMPKSNSCTCTVNYHQHALAGAEELGHELYVITTGLDLSQT